LKNKDKIIEELETELEEKPARVRNTKNIDLYDIVNFHKFMRTQDAKLLLTDKEGNQYLDPKHYAYDPYETAFDKLKKDKKFFDYQQKFIEDWTLSSQELVILYYGVGSGKTTIAVNCAEQFQNINDNAHIYFLTPASLVLGTIKECYERGIDPTRKNSNGDYIYYFVSYQQLLGSKFDFKENSLLIIDEAHNLRNINSKEINEKVNARKYIKTGNYSLIGTVLSIKLLETSSKFLRTIFMTGTLFVNNPEDIESLISIGYKKQPLLDIDRNIYDSIIHSDSEFKIYYEGLISFFRLKRDDPRFPQKKFEFVKINSTEVELITGSLMRTEDAYFRTTRNQGTEEKLKWILKFLSTRRKERTLIYSQFLTTKIKPLKAILEKNKYRVGFISGENTQTEKLNIVSQYNNGEIDVLIFTLSIKEGISFKLTNNIIVFEPYWNYAILEQVLARGIRANSHPNGQKSTIHIYFLVAVNPRIENVDKWFNEANKAMNNDIKMLIYPTEITETKDGEKLESKLLGVFENNFESRDIDLFNRMFNKQESINIFEKKLLSLPRFEDVNNNENSEFVREYTALILLFEKKKKRKPTNKEDITMKKELYKDLYQKNIANVDNRIKRFNKDFRYKPNRNPDLEQKLSNKNYENKIPEIIKLIETSSSLSKIFEVLKIDKAEITQFQANFTPTNEVNFLIENSGIKNDKREKIFVLEPTAGIGGVVGQCLLLPNKQNLMIDANEYHNAFFQIGKAMYNGIDNVKYYNSDFWIYQNKYSYDYILGNPPFNLKHQVLEKITFRQERGKPPPDPPFIFKKVDKTLYDIHFVSKAYNMLSNDGILSFIISDRYLREKNIPVFEIFRQYMKDLEKKGAYKYLTIGGFKADKGITKSQETNFPMVNIILKKIKDYNINIDNPKSFTKRVEIDEETLKEFKEEKKSDKKENKKKSKIEKPKIEKPKIEKPKIEKPKSKKITLKKKEIKIEEPKIEELKSKKIKLKKKEIKIEEPKIKKLIKIKKKEIAKPSLIRSGVKIIEPTIEDL
jgi:superfamily II DNA or RNA helicase